MEKLSAEERAARHAENMKMCSEEEKRREGYFNKVGRDPVYDPLLTIGKVSAGVVAAVWIACKIGVYLIDR